MNVRMIYKIIDDFAPFKIQEDYDNSGLNLGNFENNVKNILFTFDVTEESVNYAINSNCDLIISHHPFIFSPIKSLNTNNYKGKIIKQLFENNISIISAHTNLDKVEKGISYVLAEILELKEMKILFNDPNYPEYGLGYIGKTGKISIDKYLYFIKEKLNTPLLQCYNYKNDKLIETVSVCGGSGSDLIDISKENNSDIFITGDIKYHDTQLAKELDLIVVDCGHYYTEYLGLKYLIKEISNNTENIGIYKYFQPFVNFYILA